MAIRNYQRFRKAVDYNPGCPQQVSGSKTYGDYDSEQETEPLEKQGINWWTKGLGYRGREVSSEKHTRLDDLTWKAVVRRLLPAGLDCPSLTTAICQI